MERLGANGLRLRSGENVVLCFPNGDRPATQAASHEQIRAMVTEVAPQVVLTQLQQGLDARFEYESEGKVYTLTVDADTSGWTVVVVPSTPPRGDDMVIERHAHQYDDSPPVAAGAATGAGGRSRFFPAGTTPGVAEGTGPAVVATAAPAVPAAEKKLLGYDPVAISPSERWLDAMLKALKQRGGSDLHLTSGAPPYMRISGELKAIDGAQPMDPAWLKNQILEIAPPDCQKEFEERSDTDFAYNLSGISRFRVNAFVDRNGPGLVARAIPFEIPSAEQLGLTAHIMALCDLTKGLVLVTGPTGSGKSTTLAALIDRINSTRHDHIVTIEDPIEFVHPNKLCLVNQREVRTHTRSFKDALRATLREDPDIVLVGEMRDLETVAIAIETAETGHLVFGTLHTTSAPGTVDRIIDQFPADRQEQIRQMLAKSLRGVISQVLCRTKLGARVAAYEVLLANSAVENLIRERKTFQLISLMQTAGGQGMSTMEASLMELVRSGKIEPTEAYRKAINKSELKTALARIGINL
jgi:twitching motility protein PilT